MSFENAIQVTVSVKPRVPEAKLKVGDCDLPGVYHIDVSQKVKRDWVANAALDAFFESYGVMGPEDFFFEVEDGDELLFPDRRKGAPEDDALAEYANIVKVVRYDMKGLYDQALKKIAPSLASLTEAERFALGFCPNPFTYEDLIEESVQS